MKKRTLYFLLVLCLVFFLFRFFHCRIVFTYGGSMEPTYTSGDLLLVTKLMTEPQPGEAVLIEHQGTLMVKRICAVSGQQARTPAVPGEDGRITVGTNTITGVTTFPQSGDAPFSADTHPYWTAHLGTGYCSTYHYWDAGNSTASVPEGMVFLTGDNLATSIDSRYRSFGLIPNEQILGKVLCVIWDR